MVSYSAATQFLHVLTQILFTANTPKLVISSDELFSLSLIEVGFDSIVLWCTYTGPR